MTIEAPAPRGPQPELEPPWVRPRIIGAPKIRQLYWCDFPLDAHLPEMWKTRPVLVVSYKNRLHGPCSVLPCSTKPQDENEWAKRLSISLDGRATWVICNHIHTFAPSRFSTSAGRKIPYVPEPEFNEIMRIVLRWLPTPR